MRAAVLATALALVGCAQRASLPGGGGIGDPPLECGFEVANASLRAFALVESIPVALVEGGLRPGESRRVEASCAPACYVFRASLDVGGREDGPAAWTQVVARPSPARWVRVELRAPDPFGRDVGMWQLAREAGCSA